MKKWSQEKTDGLKSKKCKKPRFFYLFFIFLSCFFHFSVRCSDSLDFAKCSSLFPNFLVENAAKHRKSMEKNKEHDEKWIEMMKNGQCTIKIRKANDKKMKNEKTMKKWSQEKTDELKSQKCKTHRFFHLFFISLSCFFHFSVLCSESLDFAKCSSLFPNFLAAKHKRSMKKTKNMMRNE